MVKTPILDLKSAMGWTELLLSPYYFPFLACCALLPVLWPGPHSHPHPPMVYGTESPSPYVDPPRQAAVFVFHNLSPQGTQEKVPVLGQKTYQWSLLCLTLTASSSELASSVPSRLLGIPVIFFNRVSFLLTQDALPIFHFFKTNCRTLGHIVNVNVFPVSSKMLTCLHLCKYLSDLLILLFIPPFIQVIFWLNNIKPNNLVPAFINLIAQ